MPYVPTLLPDVPHLLAFAAASLALNVTPGADMTFVATAAAQGGRRSGIAASLGIAAGCLVHLAAAVLGLSVIIAASPVAFTVLKWAGGAYLAYLAFALIRGETSPTEAAPVPRSDLATFRSGVLVNVLNPKVGLFFLAFLPQFVDPAAGSVAIRTLILGLWFGASGTAVNILVALATARAATRLGTSPRIARALRWLTATVMGTLAVRLVISREG